jgi:hypothetical protein
MFEVLSKAGGNFDPESATVTISAFRIKLNRAAMLMFGKDAPRRVLILVDRESHRIGFKASKPDDKRSYRLFSSGGIAASKVKSRISMDETGDTVLKAKWNADDNQIECELKSVYKNNVIR